MEACVIASKAVEIAAGPLAAEQMYFGEESLSATLQSSVRCLQAWHNPTPVTALLGPDFMSHPKTLTAGQTHAPQLDPVNKCTRGVTDCSRQSVASAMFQCLP